MSNNNKFDKRLANGEPLFIDGGLGTQLERQGIDLNSKLWSARVLMDNPQAIIDAHLAFFRAGAHCAISASYQATVAGFQSLGLTTEDAEALLMSSVKLAINARDQYLTEHPQLQDSLLVAASVGPYGAALGDGSEYTGYADVSDDTLTEFHQHRLQLLDRCAADVLACETIPSLQEARVLAELLRSVDTPAWVAFSCRDGQHLNDGTPISEVARLFSDHPRVRAIGVNCTAPQYINELIQCIKRVDDTLNVVVYPNSGEHFSPETKRWSGTASPSECAHAAHQWLQSGARIIGGCCRMGPEHIDAIIHYGEQA